MQEPSTQHDDPTWPHPLHRPDERLKPDAQKIAIFLTTEQLRWVTIGLDSLPRAVCKPPERALSPQVAEHAEVH